MDNIKVVLFDFAGVMTTGNDWFGKIREFLKQNYNIGEEKLNDAITHTENLTNGGTSDGTVSDEFYWQTFCNFLNIKEPYTYIMNLYAMGDATSINDNMKKLVEKLKPNYTTALLTININCVMDVLIKGKRINNIFDKVYSSSWIGLRKPDPKAFLHVLKDLNVKANEVLFIDDTLENILSAKDLGINVILFENYNQLIADIKTMYNLDGI